MKSNTMVGAVIIITGVLIAGYEHHRMLTIFETYLPVFLKSQTHTIAAKVETALNNTENLNINHISLTTFPSLNVRIEINNPSQIRIIHAANGDKAPPQWFVDLLILQPIEYQVSIYKDSDKRATIYTDIAPNGLLQELWIASIVGSILFIMLFVFFIKLFFLKEKFINILVARLLLTFKQVIDKKYEYRLDIESDLLVNDIMSKFNNMIESQQQEYDLLLREKTKFEKLSHYDELTGLENKQSFLALMKEKLSNEDCGGYILLLKLSSLDQINLQLGRQEGDIYISRMANVFNKLCDLKNIEGDVFRNTGSEILMVINTNDHILIDSLAEELKDYLSRLDNDSYHHGCGYFSIIPFKYGQKLSELMTLLDCNLSQAMAKYHNAYIISQPHDVSIGGLNDWYDRIDEILTTKTITLHQHLVASNDKKMESYQYEIYASFEVQGTFYDTNEVFCAAKRFDLCYKIDQLILTRLIDFLETTENNDRYAIKISAESITNDRFRNWVSHLLFHHQKMKGRLVFQIPELTMSEDKKAIQLFVDVIHNGGCLVAIECENQHNALDFVTATKLLNIDMIRVISNHSESGVVLENEEFIETLVDSSHKVDVPVIAGQVENAKIWQLLNKIGIDACQGYLFGKPTIVAS